MPFSKLMTLGQLKAIGIKDDRWTIQDKLSMYKGIIKIHSREQKNQIKDTNVLKKKNYKKIALLQKEVKELHQQVTIVLHGDKSVIRTLLHSHDELQKSYINMNLEKIIEDLNHRLFCRKKHLNVIRHQKNQKKKQLLFAQIQIGDLHTIINSPDFARTNLKHQAITNAIQNYDVKFCAAKNIQSVYRRMLAILRKDQRYYEAILMTLQSDSNSQHKCLIRATEMGQLAMEEMANMKSEYARLEKEVRNNMIDREFNLKEIRDRLVDLHEESQGLVRTESEFDVQITPEEEPKKKGKDIEQELRELDETLTRLRDVTAVPDIRNILPSMLTTLRQKKRLLEELKINAAACDDMLNKKNHADLMYYSLYHSGSEITQRYEEESKELQTKIDEQKERLEQIIVEQNKVSTQSVELRTGLQRLSQMLENVKTPPDYVDEAVPVWPVSNLSESLRPITEEKVDSRPPINQEALRLMNLIDAKMKFIKLRLKEMDEPAEKERAFVAHLKWVSEFMASNRYSAENIIEAPALIVDVVLEDSQVPNRMEIKARSQAIYAAATRNPFEVEEPKPKKRQKEKVKFK